MINQIVTPSCSLILETLSSQFCKNIHFIHKNSHRIISDSCDYFAFS